MTCGYVLQLLEIFVNHYDKTKFLNKLIMSGITTYNNNKKNVCIILQHNIHNILVWKYNKICT